MATKTKLRLMETPPADDGRGIPAGDRLPLPQIDGHQLVVDESIREAIPALSDKHREGLYNSLRVHGLFTPITLVEMPDGTRIVLDGHERLALWATCEHEVEGWKPPLPLRADVLPLCDIVGKEEDAAVCSALLVARAIAINTARRQMTQEKVGELIRDQLLREYAVGMQRLSTWLAAELGVALSWLIEIRTGMWDSGEIPCPKDVLTKKGYQENKAFKGKESRPDTSIKARSLPPSGVFEEEEKPVGSTRPDEFPEEVEDELEGSEEETPAQPTETEPQPAPEEEQAVVPEEVETFAARFAWEWSILTRWNSQRPEPFSDGLLTFLWGAGLVDFSDDEEEVRLLLDRETLDRNKLEGLFVGLITPIVKELDIPEIKVIEAVHSLLNPPAPKTRKK